jgi:hypothetical protein
MLLCSGMEVRQHTKSSSLYIAGRCLFTQFFELSP